MTRKAAVAGLALALAYAAFAAVSSHPSGRRPLYDSGFGPQVPYRWVHPPVQFSSVNVKPKPALRTVDLGPKGSATTALATDDGQALLSLEAGAVPPHPPDTKVEVRLVPTDATKLAKLPPGTRFEGNAYDVVIRYQPSGQAVRDLSAPATIALTGAGLADTLYFSADRRSWEKVDGALPFGLHSGLTADVRAAGYYVVSSPGQPYKLGGGSNRVPYVIAALVVLILVGVGVGRWRLRAR